jgi:hypothetical protein
MGISAAATEAQATALIAECRRCLTFGLDLKGIYVKDVLDQLQSATTNDLSGRTDVVPNNFVDGRTAGEIAVIA